MKQNYLPLFLIITHLSFSLSVKAQQPTIGLQYHDINTYDGYTLFTPESNENVYLINNCGEKINTWTFTERPGLTCYLLENGNLLRAGKDSIEIRDWDNNLVWSYLLANISINQHHDIEPLPNGNILCVTTDLYSDIEMIAQGRNPAITDVTFKLDKIVELQPIGVNDVSIVWEWKFIDHFIQDFDNTKSNYGIIDNHPELLDLNYDNGETRDYTHLNSIDYNADLDQIIISARHLSEIYIIDHSTTITEAAGHTGGNSGHGGDFLWRWGNPQVYKQGDNSFQKLFLQHDAKWVENGYLDEGKISVFNNGGNANDLFSSIHLIEPNIIGGIYTKTNSVFAPLDFDWSWNGSILGSVVQEGRKSATHALPNGNFIICETGKARFSEITKTGIHLWTYVNPHGNQLYNQFEAAAGNAIFRAEKYPIDYVGFTGKDLTPQGLIEDVNSVSSACLNSLSVNETVVDNLLIVNPIKNKTLKFNKSLHIKKIQLFDVSGRLVYKQFSLSGSTFYLNLPSAIYFMQLELEDSTIIKKLILK